MKANYCEFEGDNWTGEWAIEGSECTIHLDDETAEEVLDGAELTMLSTSNNAQVKIAGKLLVLSGRRGYWYQLNTGADWTQCSREKALEAIESLI